MMTVALKIDAPVRLPDATLTLTLITMAVLITLAHPLLPSQVKLIAANAPTASSPYAVLGLGDIAIPAFFCALLNAFDASLAADDPDAPPPPYQRNAVAAYAVGLVAAFAANELVRRGQPALLYLVPATLGSALLTAAHRNELRTLLAFEAPDSET
jgi:minor histocompatibility antigen H13